MKLNWKSAILAGLVVLLMVCSGCGGITASHSISPATFFLPGFGQLDPDPAVQPCETNTLASAPQLATLR